MAITVTATQGGSTANGLNLRVFVLTGAAAAASQSGATVATSPGSGAAFQASLTTTQTGSRVYGAGSYGPQAAPTANAQTAGVDAVSDATNGEEYVSFKGASTTGTPGATTFGYSSTTGGGGPLAMLEVLPSGTLAEDSSGPANVSTTSALTVTTASFTPPGGSLLVALIGSDGGVGVTTYTVSDTSSLTWTEKVKQNPSGGDYAGVWIAQVPASAGPAGKAMPLPPSRLQRRYQARARLGPDYCAGDGNIGPGNAPPVAGTPQPPQYLIAGRSARLAETYRMNP